MNKIILDLCGGTGSWNKPYKDAGYDIYNITWPEYDVLNTRIVGNRIEFRNYNYKCKLALNKKNIYGILAAPPCTMFSFARTKAKTLRDLRQGMLIVRACLDLIWKCMEIKQETKYKAVPLKFWALENPNGMLKYFLGKPAFEFSPYEFGDPYKKRTHLWGYFNIPKKKCADYKSAEVLSKFDKMKTKEIHPEYYGKLTRTERRAITPQGFAQAFFKANQ